MVRILDTIDDFFFIIGKKLVYAAIKMRIIRCSLWIRTQGKVLISPKKLLTRVLKAKTDDFSAYRRTNNKGDAVILKADAFDTFKFCTHYAHSSLHYFGRFLPL